MGRAATLGLRAGIATATVAAAMTACGSSNTSSTSGSTPPPASATTPGGGTGTGAAKADILIKDFAFSPAQLAAKVGQPVTVVNEDAVAHTWTADNGTFDSGTLAQGKTFTFTFSKAGAYSYICSIHPRMKGTITVN